MADGPPARQPARTVNCRTAEPEPFVETMMGLHEHLDLHFFVHQQALLDRDFARATVHLEAYATRLLDHIHDENTHVLPLYQRLGGDHTDAPSRLFLGEHQKLRDFVADFAMRLAVLRAQPDDRLLLDLFDRQATFKNLSLHHDLRERHGLYPFLAARLSCEQRAAVLAARRWSGA